MIVGMPSMGHVSEAVRSVLEALDVRTLPSPRTTPACVELGKAAAPEFVCFPFTATLGQMRLLLEQGANTLLMVGGKGHCRLGWYAQVQEHLLRDLGYSFDMVIADAPLPLREKWGKFSSALHTVTGGAPWPRLLGELYRGYRLLQAMDRAEALTLHLRAVERVRGAGDRLLARQLARLPRAASIAEIARLERDFAEEAAALEVDDTDPLHLRETGEIWVVLEPGATREVERWLGARPRTRVVVHRDQSASRWFASHVLHLPASLRRDEEILRAARPWLSHPVGGHGQTSIGEVVRARADGMDGVLHVFPFTCMPEIIAQNILVRVADDLDIPVLTYIVSEQQGEAGMETRLESFLDLLEERRGSSQRTVVSGQKAVNRKTGS